MTFFHCLLVYMWVRTHKLLRNSSRPKGKDVFTGELFNTPPSLQQGGRTPLQFRWVYFHDVENKT